MSQVENLPQPLAVIGMACRLPGADNIGEYWELLKEGRSGLTQFSADRLNPDLYYHPEPGQFCKSYTRAGGSVELRAVDPNILPVAEETLNQYDLAHQTFCEVAAAACKDAGYDPLNLPHRRTAVYVGNSSGGSGLAFEMLMTDYVQAAAGFLKNIPEFSALTTDQQTAIQSRIVDQVQSEYARREESQVHDVTAGVAATAVSNLFGLTGPNGVVDAACASATIALELAAQALFHNRAEMAIVGGASFRKWYEMVVIAQAATLSAQGISSPFDANADGLVAADAFGAVIIKTLDRAIAEGDEIQAVIRNSTFSSDGKGKSFWAPRKEGQVLALNRAYQSGIDPNRLQYIETHATSTQIGDETEVQTLVESLSHRIDHTLPIASVKANVGHSLETAGLSALIKTILAIRNQTIPPAINCQQLATKIDWNSIPFEVNLKCRPWDEQPDGSARMAGVDAFGIGGVNTHVVVEEYVSGVSENGTNGQTENQPAKSQSNQEPIAIVGRGALFAGSYSVEQFAETIQAELSQITNVPADRTLPEQDSRFDEAGFLTEYKFDWRKHKVPPKLIQLANPLQFILVDAAKGALLEAGYEEENFNREEVTTIVGTIFNNDYDLDVYWGLFYPVLCEKLTPLLSEVGLSATELDEFFAEFKAQIIKLKPAMLDDTGSASASTLATRVAKNFDLMGGAFSIDAGEASSQAALMASIDLLRSGKCERVVCAGAQRWIETARNVCTAETPLGEGAGVVVLQRLSDAQRENRPIFGVIKDVVVQSSSEVDIATSTLTTANGLAKQIGNTLGASGMATLLQSTLNRTNKAATPEFISTKNRRGYLNEAGSCWTIEYHSDYDLMQEPMDISDGAECPSTPHLNSTPLDMQTLSPELQALVQFLLVQTGCPAEVISLESNLAGDLCLDHQAKENVLVELFRRLEQETTPTTLHACAQQVQTVDDLWEFLSELSEDLPWHKLSNVPTSATSQQVEVQAAVASEPSPSSYARYVQRMIPMDLNESSGEFPVLTGATILLGENKAADVLSEKLSAVGNVVYRLSSQEPAEVLNAQLDQINQQSPVLNLFVTSGCPDVGTEEDWSTSIHSAHQQIDFLSHWLEQVQQSGFLNQSTLFLLVKTGADFGQTGHLTSPTGAQLVGYSQTIKGYADAGLRLKVIDFFSREPAALIAKEVAQELNSLSTEANSAGSHVAYIRGSRFLLTGTVQPLLNSINKNQPPLSSWVPHGSFSETLIQQLQPSLSTGAETDNDGLLVGLEQIQTKEQIPSLLNEIVTVLTENSALRKIVILVPFSSFDSIKQLAASTLFAFLQQQTQSNSQLSLSLLQFDDSISDVNQALNEEGRHPRTEGVILVPRSEESSFIQNEQFAALCSQYQMIDTAIYTSENEGVCSLSFDPQVDPFLTGHLHLGQPLLPAVMGIESCSQAASLMSGGQPVVGIRNIDLVNGFRMTQPQVHHVTVKTNRTETTNTGGSFDCQLTGEFYDKQGELKDPQRLYHQMTVLTGEENRVSLPPFSGVVPEGDWIQVSYGKHWQDPVEGRKGTVFYGPELQTLKEVFYSPGTTETWGKMLAPANAELGGTREGTAWQTPASLFDASLFFFEYLFNQLTGTEQLPHLIEAINYGRAPLPGEQLIAHGRFLNRDERHLTVEFDVWGADGTAILSCRNCQLVDLNITVGSAVK